MYTSRFEITATRRCGDEHETVAHFEVEYEEECFAKCARIAQKLFRAESAKVGRAGMAGVSFVCEARCIWHGDCGDGEETVANAFYDESTYAKEEELLDPSRSFYGEFAPKGENWGTAHHRLMLFSSKEARDRVVSSINDAHERETPWNPAPACALTPEEAAGKYWLLDFADGDFAGSGNIAGVSFDEIALPMLQIPTME